jgi:hypothetical protein
MNTYIPKPNSGSLFNVKEKRNPNWPDIRGEIFVSRDLLETVMQQQGDLIKMSISAWRKEAKTGNKYLSLSVSEPYEKQADSQPKPAYDAPDEDVPF